MTSRLRLQRLSAVALTALLAVLFSSGCQTEYENPQPGILEIRLKTVSNAIPFTPLNSFILSVTDVKAIRSDDAKAYIYGDLQAVTRKLTKLNTLDFRARDSVMVLGKSYVPPGDYKGIDILLSPAENVILDGYRIIDVITRPDFDPNLPFRRPFSVQEAMTTLITLEVNLDSTLLKRANTYDFRPYYSISSVTVTR
jgi:hypothetical protein